MNGKGDKWRGGWTSQYADNHDKIFGEKMKRVFMFDVDGTLTPSRQKMTPKFEKFFTKWAEKNKFYLVSGSDLDKMKEQVPDNILELAEGLFTCGGNQFWREGPTKQWPQDWRLEYENKFNPSEKLIKYLNLELNFSPYKIRAGNHIENRGAMVNFSIVGRDCTLEERLDYFKYDTEKGERKRISEAIKRQFPELDAVIGGQISIDIVPKGMDKSQIFEHIEERENFYCPDEYIFIGDRMEKGGNDYPLAELLNDRDRPYGYAYQVDGWEDTKRYLENTHNG